MWLELASEMNITITESHMELTASKARVQFAVMFSFARVSENAQDEGCSISWPPEEQWTVENIQLPFQNIHEMSPTHTLVVLSCWDLGTMEYMG